MSLSHFSSHWLSVSIIYFDKFTLCLGMFDVNYNCIELTSSVQSPLKLFSQLQLLTRIVCDVTSYRALMSTSTLVEPSWKLTMDE